jgi:hypothetical protein
MQGVRCQTTQRFAWASGRCCHMRPGMPADARQRTCHPCQPTCTSSDGTSPVQNIDCKYSTQPLTADFVAFLQLQRQPVPVTQSGWRRWNGSCGGALQQRFLPRQLGPYGRQKGACTRTAFRLAIGATRSEQPPLFAPHYPRSLCWLSYCPVRHLAAFVGCDTVL